jgi:hypothetical protein
MGYLLLNDKWGHANISAVEEILSNIDNGMDLKNCYLNALKKVIGLREEDSANHPVPAMYFKNTLSQRKLNAHLKGEMN